MLSSAVSLAFQPACLETLKLADTAAVGCTFITPNEFRHARWSLGRFSLPLRLIAMVWNLYLAAILFSPIEFPVTASTFNCEYLPLALHNHLALSSLSSA